MENRNISVSAKNGYTMEKVLLAKQYLKEIGKNKRHFDFKRLVGMYNEVFGTSESPSGCSCQSPKYYNGIANYFKYGKLTLINNGLATEADFADEVEAPEEIENADKRINLGAQEIASEPLKEDEPTVIKEEEKEEIVEQKKAGRPKKNK